MSEHLFDEQSPAPPAVAAPSSFNAGKHRMLFEFLKRRLGLSLFGEIRFNNGFWVGGVHVTPELMRRLENMTNKETKK